MDSQTAPSTKEKQDEDPFQSGGLKQPLVFSASNFAVKRGRGERGGDRWEGTHMKRRGNFRLNFPLRQFEARVWYGSAARRGVEEGFTTLGPAGRHMHSEDGGWRVERTGRIYVGTSTLKESLRAVCWWFLA